MTREYKSQLEILPLIQSAQADKEEVVDGSFQVLYGSQMPSAPISSPPAEADEAEAVLEAALVDHFRSEYQQKEFVIPANNDGTV